VQISKEGEGGDEETEKPKKKPQPVLEAEKVSVIDPKIAKSHTTFYNEIGLSLKYYNKFL